MRAAPSAAVRAVADGVVVAVRLSPKAARGAIDGLRVDADGRVYVAVRVNAPAHGGRANAAMIKLLAKTWRVPAGAITIVAGHKNRRKRLHVAGDAAVLAARVMDGLEGDR
jgi:uncharacterized protein (TIGR00251 family)